MLRLHSPPPLEVPPDRGALMTPAMVAQQLMPVGTSERTVRRRVYPRVVIGRKVYFYEADVRRWIDSQRIEESE